VTGIRHDIICASKMLEIFLNLRLTGIRWL
jgi:hypothetical protein